MIVIVFGLPGSGKSFFAARLAQKLQADYFNSDRIRKEMFVRPTYSEKEKAAVYDAMLKGVREALDKKKNIVLDATFHTNEIRDLFTEEIKGKDSLYFIEVWAAENIVRERMKEVRSYSDADYEVHKLIRQHWEPLRDPHLLLESTNENLDFMLEKAIAYLQLKNDKRTDQ